MKESLPYWFDQVDVLKIFNACENFKYLCMLKVLFYGCLRSGEMCKLDVEDYNPKELTLRLNDTKNNTDALVFINDETARALDKYLTLRDPVEDEEGRHPLFFTDYGNRYDSKEIHRIFLTIKKKAGITKKGAVHCFSRHSSATLMVARGCDLRSVQAILRHKDINTTLKYAHLSDKVKREKYEQFLKL